MGRRRFFRRIGEEVCARLLHLVERTAQLLRILRHLEPRCGQRIAEFRKRLLLECEPRFQFDHALFESRLFSGHDSSLLDGTPATDAVVRQA